MSGLLDTLGIDTKAYEEASDSAVAKQFEALPSGVYDGIVKNVILYTSVFNDKTKGDVNITNLQVNFTMKTEDGDRDISYRQDVSKLKKDGEVNQGFLQRLKTLGAATNFDIDTLSVGEETTVKSFGKDCAGNFLLGLNDKPVKLLVRHSQDTSKEEGEAYRDTNDVEGVTFSGSEDIATFEEKIAKTPIFKLKGRGGKADSKTAAKSEETKEAMAKVNF